MGYHRPGTKDIHQLIKENLQSRERFGESKYEAKRNGSASSGIYSYKTAQSYHKECQKFAEYVKEHSPQGRYTSLEDARSYLKDYIAEQNARSDISAYTVKLERSALAKLYDIPSKQVVQELGQVRDRARADIKRSRERTIISEKTGKEIKNPSTRAGHFSEKKHADKVDFARSTGLRRSEIETVHGNQLFFKEGQPYLHLEGHQCKGGQSRDLPIIGEREKVIEMCREAGDRLVFSSETFGTIPQAMDVHHYRSQYATALYKELARPISEIENQKEKYHCRGDLKGVTYDRKAMLEVSEALGHHRVSVIAEHYLR